MNMSQVWGFLRHAATVAAGVLWNNPDPRLQALGVVLGVVGGGSSMYVKRTKKGLSLPAPVLIFACLIGGAVLGGMAGCATSGGGGAVLTERDAYSLGKAGALAVLAQDAGAEEELLRVCAGIDAVFVTGELTPAQLKRFLDSAKVKPKSQLLIAAFATEAYDRFVTGQGKTVLLVSDPVIAAGLREFQRGIRDGIAFAKVFLAPPVAVLPRGEVLSFEFCVLSFEPIAHASRAIEL